MLMNGILVLAALGALGACFGLRSFSSLAFLWQLPCSLQGFGWAWFCWPSCSWCCGVCPSPWISRWKQTESRPAGALSLRRAGPNPAPGQNSYHWPGEAAPGRGASSWCANHLSLLDPLILHIYTKKSQLAFISKRENDQLFIVNKLMHKTLCQPINRENDREALKTILKCVDILEQDKASIAVFPEGYTSRTGHLQPFRNGVFKLPSVPRCPLWSAPSGEQPLSFATPPTFAGPTYTWTCWRSSRPAS